MAVKRQMSKVKNAIICCLLLCYLIGIAGPLIIDSIHILHHVLTDTLHQHLEENHEHHDDSYHGKINTPHGHEHHPVLDIAIISSAKDKSDHEQTTPVDHLRQIVDHLCTGNPVFDQPDGFSDYPANINSVFSAQADLSPPSPPPRDS
jgi:hypothetical protein